MTALRLLLTLFLLWCPLLVAFALCALAALWRDERLTGAEELSRAFRVTTALLLLAGLAVTAGLTPSASRRMAALLNAGGDEALMLGVHTVMGFLLIAYTAIAFFSYRALLRLMRQARMYRAGLSVEEGGL